SKPMVVCTSAPTIGLASPNPEVHRDHPCYVNGFLAINGESNILMPIKPSRKQCKMYTVSLESE
ncbi:MAG: hypothetical protein KAR47_20905, partial [Planctomycetes bacterium]|nr:hypothetical protein [Planctomycetota bacterium]